MRPQVSRRGRLKVFLSYAAGAGKTYRMLEEAQELKKVLGATSPEDSAAIHAVIVSAKPAVTAAR